MENRSEWFPRTKKDLDKSSRKILELEADHPVSHINFVTVKFAVLCRDPPYTLQVFKDQDYRKRREHFAVLANKYEQ